jgi:DNA-binding response OmpR family regulator
VLRRRTEPNQGPTRVGEIVVDPARRAVTVGDRRVELSNKEFALLRMLVSDPTRVFTKEELLRDVWGFRSMGRTRTLDSHASRLRRKLDPEHGRYVVNCWGVGYRLIEG